MAVVPKVGSTKTSGISQDKALFDIKKNYKNWIYNFQNSNNAP